MDANNGEYGLAEFGMAMGGCAGSFLTSVNVEPGSEEFNRLCPFLLNALVKALYPKIPRMALTDLVWINESPSNAETWLKRNDRNLISVAKKTAKIQGTPREEVYMIVASIAWAQATEPDINLLLGVLYSQRDSLMK